MILDDLLF